MSLNCAYFTLPSKYFRQTGCNLEYISITTRNCPMTSLFGRYVIYKSLVLALQSDYY